MANQLPTTAPTHPLPSEVTEGVAQAVPASAASMQAGAASHQQQQVAVPLADGHAPKAMLAGGVSALPLRVSILLIWAAFWDKGSCQFKWPVL